MKCKFLSALISIGLLCSMPVHASDEIRTDMTSGLRYSVQEDHIVIRGMDNRYFQSEIVIPEQIENLPVTEINKNAFSYSSADLTAVTFPDTLEIIGENAFYYSGLKHIEIPEHVISIGKGAFMGVDTVTVDENNPAFTVENNILYNKDLTEFILIPASVTEVNIPDTITEIPDRTFDCHKALIAVTLPEGLTSIGQRAFSQTGISEITIPSTVTEIGNQAFEFCPNLTSITFAEGMKTIPSNLTEIETIYCGVDENGNPDGWSEFSYEYYGGFMRSYALRKVYLPSTLETVQESVFGCNDYYYHQFDVFYHGTREDWENVHINSGISATLEKGGNQALLTANMHFLPSSDMMIDGDVTLDNTVTVADLVLLHKYLLNQNTLSEYEALRADFNHDHSINIFDLLLLKKQLLS